MGKTVAAMVVGPGEGHRHLDRVLRCARTWADVIVAYGAGVDPDTAHALLDGVGCAALEIEREGQGAFCGDESVVRNKLLGLVDAVAEEGDIVVVLDADEELCSLRGKVTDELRAAHASDRGAWPCLFVHLWAPDGSLMRVDGGWRPGYAVRLYRHRPGARISGRAFACAPVPEHFVGMCPLEETPFAMRHWGYAHPHDRERKRAFYLEHDGGRYHSRRHLESITKEPTLEAAWL